MPLSSSRKHPCGRRHDTERRRWRRTFPRFRGQGGLPPAGKGRLLRAITPLPGRPHVRSHVHHLHHAQAVGRTHAELRGGLQPGLVDMAVIGLLRNSASVTADSPGELRRGIHAEEHSCVSIAHLLHVFLPHPAHSDSAHAVEHHLHTLEAEQHPQKGDHFLLFEIVEQAAGGNQYRRVRRAAADPPDPVA